MNGVDFKPQTEIGRLIERAARFDEAATMAWTRQWRDASEAEEAALRRLREAIVGMEQAERELAALAAKAVA